MSITPPSPPNNGNAGRSGTATDAAAAAAPAAADREAGASAQAPTDAPADGFDGSARPGVAFAAPGPQANPLTSALPAMAAAQMAESADLAAALNELFAQAGLSSQFTAASLKGLSPEAIHLLLQEALAQLSSLAQQHGLTLEVDAHALTATLNGNPATLIDTQTDATVLWRALALSNPPLGIATFVATGKAVDADSGLLPNQAYSVRGTFLDANQVPHVRLAATGPGGGSEEEGRLGNMLSVAFSSLNKALLLALLGDPRIDIPYNNALSETGGPIDAACCQFTHSQQAASPTHDVAHFASHLNEPRCKSCSFARQLCLPG